MLLLLRQRVLSTSLRDTAASESVTEEIITEWNQKYKVHLVLLFFYFAPRDSVLELDTAHTPHRAHLSKCLCRIARCPAMLSVCFCILVEIAHLRKSFFFFSFLSCVDGADSEEKAVNKVSSEEAEDILKK